VSITRTSHRPTVVLVHGAFAESSRWDGVVDVKALVFVGAFAPEAGESAAELTGRHAGSTPEETLDPVALPDGGTDLSIAQDRYPAQFAADVPVRVAERMAATQRPIAAAALAEAERAGARRTVELPGASHAVAVSEAAAVAGLIREAAGATASRPDDRADVERVEVGA
jgi:pimeloyl-ACP methyl ester carboxylesterase